MKIKMKMKIILIFYLKYIILSNNDKLYYYNIYFGILIPIAVESR